MRADSSCARSPSAWALIALLIFNELVIHDTRGAPAHGGAWVSLRRLLDAPKDTGAAVRLIGARLLEATPKQRFEANEGEDCGGYIGDADTGKCSGHAE